MVGMIPKMLLPTFPASVIFQVSPYRCYCFINNETLCRLAIKRIHRQTDFIVKKRYILTL